MDPCYFVTCSDGALCLYYTTKNGGKAQVIMSAESVALCKSGGTDPKLEAMFQLSDAFGEQKQVEAAERAGRPLLMWPDGN